MASELCAVERDEAGRLPLAGRRIVVTRAREQAAELADAIRARGGEALVFPSIRIIEPERPELLRAAANRLPEYDWVVFTSINGVHSFWAALEDGGGGAHSFRGIRVAAVGPATAAALGHRGVATDLIPRRYVGEGLLQAMLERGLAAPGSPAGTRVLLPVARDARSVLERGLRAAGAQVDRVEAYRTVPDFEGGRELREQLATGMIDAITFTSPSTVTSFVAAVGRDVEGCVVATIGPITAAAARQEGVAVAVEARVYTVEGLLTALSDHFGRERGSADGV